MISKKSRMILRIIYSIPIDKILKNLSQRKRFLMDTFSLLHTKCHLRDPSIWLKKNRCKDSYQDKDNKYFYQSKSRWFFHTQQGEVKDIIAFQ